MKLSTSLIIVTLAGGTLWAQTPATIQAAQKNLSQATGTKPPSAQATAHPAAKPAATAAKPAVVAKSPATPVSTSAHPVAAASIKPAAKPASTQAPAAKATPPAAPQHAAAKPAVVKTPAPAKAAPVAAAPQSAAKKPAVAEKKPVVEKKQIAEKKPVVAEPKPKEGEVKPAVAKEATVSRVSGAAGRRDPFVSPLVRASAGGQGPVCDTGKRCLVVDQILLKGIVKSANGYIAVVENAAKRAYFLRENDPVFNGSVVRITGDTVVFREQTTDKLGKQSMREVMKKVNAPVV